MITLRAVTDADLPIFFEIQRDEEAARRADVPSRDYESFMAHWAKIRADESVIIRAIVFDGQVVGNVLSFERDRPREVGYWLGRAYWGRGIASAALTAFLPLVPQRPLYGVVSKGNPASRRVLEKCGFTLDHEEGDLLVLKLSA